MVQSYARAERIWQSSSIIINLYTGNGAGVWMKPCPEEMSWEFEYFKKTVSWDRPLKVAVEFFGSRPAEMNWDLKHHKMHRAWGGRGFQHSMVSTCFYDLCLSPRVAKDWSQKLINPSVSETIEWRLYLYMYLYYYYYWCIFTLYEYTTIPFIVIYPCTHELPQL